MAQVRTWSRLPLFRPRVTMAAIRTFAELFGHASRTVGQGAGPDASLRASALTAWAGAPVLLAPMEDVSDAVFRRLCRKHGADLCVTEFVNAEGLLRGCRNASRKISLAADDQP